MYSGSDVAKAASNAAAQSPARRALAWMDRTKDKVGYEINFNRQLYKFTPPKPLTVIDAELKEAEDEILRLLREVME